jgi:hypothetical protein
MEEECIQALSGKARRKDTITRNLIETYKNRNDIEDSAGSGQRPVTGTGTTLLFTL